MANTGCLCRPYGILMLLEAAARFHGAGADEQETGGSGKGLGKLGLVVKICITNLDTLGSKDCQLLRLARGGDDLAGWNLVGCQQVIDNGLAEMAGSSGNEIHDFLLCLQCSRFESNSHLEFFENGTRRHFRRPWLHGRNCHDDFAPPQIQT